MRFNQRFVIRVTLLIAAMAALIVASSRLQAQTGCPSNPTPFTDLGSMPTVFCASVAEAYFSGLTSGTSATTYSPAANVTRDQMSAFVTRTLNQSLRRGSRRAALNQWWTLNPTTDPPLSAILNLVTTPVGNSPRQVASDGADLWVAHGLDDTFVSRVRASDGKRLQNIDVGVISSSVLVAMGRIFVHSHTSCSGWDLIMMDPKTGDATTVAGNVGVSPRSIAFDGTRIWVTNGYEGCGTPGFVSIVTPGNTTPWSITPVPSGFSQPYGILFDGSNIWVTDRGDNTIKKLNSSGGILQSVPVGDSPGTPIFDGINIWVPNFDSNDVTVVRASTGTVLRTVTAPFMSGPETAAFDGERVLITCRGAIDGLYLFKASSLSFLASVGTGSGTDPWGACSDGQHFWVTLNGTDQLMRF